MKTRPASRQRVSVLSPFGPRLIATELPPQTVADFNRDCDQIGASVQRRRELDRAPLLSGRVHMQYAISPETLRAHSGFFRRMAIRFILSKSEELSASEKNRYRIECVDAWYVRQWENEYNPVHHHPGCDISCVGYLRLPDDSEEFFGEELKHHRQGDGGLLQFYHGAPGLNSTTVLKVRPTVRAFYMFPWYLDHVVYPFTSRYRLGDVRGERRSFSMNFRFQRL